MSKELPQHTPERLWELVNKHLVPALQKQPKPANAKGETKGA